MWETGKRELIESQSAYSGSNHCTSWSSSLYAAIATLY